MPSEGVSAAAHLTHDDDPRERLLSAPLSRFQATAIAVTVALCALDGFDILAITFAAPGISAEWAIGKAALGLVFSAGLMGVAAGSFLLAPLADHVGRRPMVLVSLAIMALGTFWSAMCGSLVTLAGSRLFTGLGIGTMIAVINPLAAEYANAKRRDLAVSLLNIGYPVGGVAGGLLAAALLPQYGWRSIFACVGVLCLLMFPVVLRFLPEPPGYLIGRPRRDALERVNRFLVRAGQTAVASLPAGIRTGRSPTADLFRGGMKIVTVKVTAIYLLNVIPVFYMQNWVPTLVADLGFSAAEAASVSTWLNVGGVLGGLFVGLAASRFGLKPVVVGTLLSTSVLINLFGSAPASLPLLRAAALVAGFCVFSAMVGVYAVVSRSFPTRTRASGTGLVIGVGRLGSVASPLLASALFSSGLARPGVSAVMAIPAFLAAFVLVSLAVPSPSEVESSSK